MVEAATSPLTALSLSLFVNFRSTGRGIRSEGDAETRDGVAPTTARRRSATHDAAPRSFVRSPRSCRETQRRPHRHRVKQASERASDHDSSVPYEAACTQKENKSSGKRRRRERQRARRTQRDAAVAVSATATTATQLRGPARRPGLLQRLAQASRRATDPPLVATNHAASEDVHAMHSRVDSWRACVSVSELYTRGAKWEPIEQKSLGSRQHRKKRGNRKLEERERRDAAAVTAG